MIDILKYLMLLLKITGQDEKIRDMLVDTNPAEIIFSSFLRFGSEKMTDFSWDNSVTYVWVVFFAIWALAFYQLVVGREKAGSIFGDYIMNSSVNRRMFSLIPESILRSLKGTAHGYMMVIIASIFKPWVYLGVAMACSLASIWLMGDALFTIFFESYYRSPLLATTSIIADISGFTGVLVLQMIFTALGLYLIPIIEAGKASKLVLTEGAELFFWLNLPITFLVALSFSIGAAFLGSSDWYAGLLGHGLIMVGRFIPWVIWIGSWVETIIKVIAQLVLLVLASQGVPVGPVQQSLRYGIRNGMARSALSYGGKRIGIGINKDQRTRPSQIDDIPMEGNI